MTAKIIKRQTDISSVLPENRKKELESLEADAQRIVKGFEKANDIRDKVFVLHKKFKDVVEEMRPAFQRVRLGFAHLRKDETIMGERTGEAWAKKYLGVTYHRVRECLNPPKRTLLLTDGTQVVSPDTEENPALPGDTVVSPSTVKSETGQGNASPVEGSHTKDPLPKLNQTLPTTPSRTADWTDNEYIKICVDFIESTLRPLESDSDPNRLYRVAVAITEKILGDLKVEHIVENKSKAAAAGR